MCVCCSRSVFAPFAFDCPRLTGVCTACVFTDGLNPRSSAGSFAQEAVDEITNMLTEDQFKGKLLLILAGYEREMDEMLQANPGLRSRIPGKIIFDPFDEVAACAFLRQDLRKAHGLHVNDESVASSVLQSMAQELVDAPNFASGRDVRLWSKNVFRQIAITSQRQPSGSSQDAASFDHLRKALDELLASKQTAAGPPGDSTGAIGVVGVAFAPMAPMQPPAPPVVIASAPLAVCEEIQADEATQAQGPDDDTAVYSLLEEAASQLGYTIYQTRDMCAASEFPEDILSHVMENTQQASREAVKAALVPQCPALLSKMTAMIKENEAEIARVKAKEEARIKALEEAERQAEAQRLRREQIIRCQACGSPTCSFMPRVVGYRDVPI